MGAFECLGQVIGTVRVLPMNLGLAPCDAVVAPRPEVPPRLREHSWEVGRLVLAPQFRSGPELLRRCLALTLVHMMERVPVENIFATCKPVLARLYRRFGYSVLVKDIPGPDGEGYCLIHGPASAVLHAVVDDGMAPVAPIQ